MNIYNNIRNFICDNHNFICVLDNKIYLYNIISIDEISDTKLVVLFNNKKVIINGNNIKLIRSENKELELTCNIERIIINEDTN
ncbi:MAG: hypothetical protein E7159_02380 [Firmicutes bacterium]|nr:hypothetical protein [Bacillota bacterium]